MKTYTCTTHSLVIAGITVSFKPHVHLATRWANGKMKDWIQVRAEDAFGLVKHEYGICSAVHSGRDIDLQYARDPFKWSPVRICPWCGTHWSEWELRDGWYVRVHPSQGKEYYYSFVDDVDVSLQTGKPVIVAPALADDQRVLLLLAGSYFHYDGQEPVQEQVLTLSDGVSTVSEFEYPSGGGYPTVETLKLLVLDPNATVRVEHLRRTKQKSFTLLNNAGELIQE